MELRKPYRNIANRLRGASKIQFLCDIVNLTAIVYVLYFGYKIANSRVDKNVVIPTINILIFYSASVYTIIHRLILPYFLKKSEKWIQAHRSRHRKFAVALIRLTKCIISGKTPMEEIVEIENGILSAMLSNVEEVVVDIEGIYLNITILMNHQRNNDMLVSVNRAKKERPCKEYPKKDLLAWKAMIKKTKQYNPDFSSEVDDPRPYKCILAIPIISRSSGDEEALGAISIDSEVRDHFNGIIDEIVLRLLPYFTLLRLLLFYRQKIGGKNA